MASRKIIINEEEDVESVLGRVEDPDVSPNRAYIQGTSIAGVLINLIAMPFLLFIPLLSGFYLVQPQEYLVILFFGKIKCINTTPGIHWSLPIGRTKIRVPTNTQTLDISKITVLDANGNPIVVAGVVTFQIVDALKAGFDVKNYEYYLKRQSLAVLKRVCSYYPYESKDGKSLQTEAGEVSRQLVKSLQTKANIAGAKIVSFELADLQYAPEIAPMMLVRQQAQAMVDARKTVVAGAVGIVTHALEQLSDSGVHLGEKEQGRMVSNLLAIICSDSHVQPTLNVGGGEESESDDIFKSQMINLLNTIKINTTPKT